MVKKPVRRRPQPHHPAHDAPRKPAPEPDEIDEDDEDEPDRLPPKPPAPPPHPEPPMPQAEPSNVVPMAPSQQSASNPELLDIIAKQAALIQSQGTAIRDLETQLGLQPGGTPLVPGASANLNNLIGMHTAAIRTQAAYMQHLNEIQLNDGV